MGRRELWWVEAGDLRAYLEGDGTAAGVEEHPWVSSAPLAQATPKQAQGRRRPCACAYLVPALRGHWGIENRVFRMRDVHYNEDRLHERQVGPGLSTLRNGALNLIRRLGYRYVPDAWRELSRCPQRLLLYLVTPL